jgi:hypothetical protein
MKKISNRIINRISRRKSFQYKEIDFIDFDFLRTQIVENKTISQRYLKSNEKDLYGFYLSLSIDSPISPHPLFNSKFYLKELNIDKKQFDLIKNKYQTLFNHFLNYGYKHDIDPHLYFSFKYVYENYEVEKKSNFWTKYITDIRYFSMNVSKNFENDFYFNNNPDVKNARLNPLVHYLKHGNSEGRSSKKSIKILSDNYVDVYNNTRVSTKLIRSSELEPLKNKRDIVYSLTKKQKFNPKEDTYIVSEDGSNFLYPYQENIKIRNRLNSNTKIEIDVGKMSKEFIKSKIKQIHNRDLTCDYLEIRFSSTKKGKELEIDPEVVAWIDFLVIKFCSEARPIFINGNSNFFRQSKSPELILKNIIAKSNINVKINNFNIYKYGHELRKLYLSECTGVLVFDKKITESVARLKITKLKLPTVSIVTCTNRPQNLTKHTLKQVTQQKYPNLEWTIVIQGDLSTKDKHIIEKSCSNLNIVVNFINIDEKAKLGSMLNVAVAASSGEYIAKFDDDDFYLANYLKNSINESLALGADMVGKWMEFTYYENYNRVYFDAGPTLNYVETEHISGSTLVFKRSLFFENFRFYEITNGEDVYFRNLLVNSGKKVYRINGFDHIVFRGSNVKNHTWQITDRYLMNETYLRNNEFEMVLDIAEAEKVLGLN